MEQTGVVIDGNNETVLVDVRRHSSCEKCGACGIGGKKSLSVEAINQMNAKSGDSVVIELESKSVFLASTIVYIIPLVLMVLGFGFGGRILNSIGINGSADLLGAASGLILLALSFLAIHLYDRNLGTKRYMPRVVRITHRFGSV